MNRAPVFRKINQSHDADEQMKDLFWGSPCPCCGNYVSDYPFVCIEYSGLMECMESWWIFVHPKCVENFLPISNSVYFRFN